MSYVDLRNSGRPVRRVRSCHASVCHFGSFTNLGVTFRAPHNKDYSNVGSILGPPNIGSILGPPV